MTLQFEGKVKFPYAKPVEHARILFLRYKQGTIIIDSFTNQPIHYESIVNMMEKDYNPKTDKVLGLVPNIDSPALLILDPETVLRRFKTLLTSKEERENK